MEICGTGHSSASNRRHVCDNSINVAGSKEKSSEGEDEGGETTSGSFWQQDVSTIKSWKKSGIPFERNQTHDVTIHYNARYAENDKHIAKLEQEKKAKQDKEGQQGVAISPLDHARGMSRVFIIAMHMIHDPAWTVSQVGLEDLVLAYMSRPAARAARPALEVAR